MKNFVLAIRPFVSVLAVLYAIFVVQQFASRNVWWGDTAAVIHVIFWTLAPPLWFLLEWWATTGNPQDLKDNQEKAGKLWAAVLVVVLYFFPKGPLERDFHSTPEAPKSAEVSK